MANLLSTKVGSWHIASMQFNRGNNERNGVLSTAKQAVVTELLLYAWEFLASLMMRN